MLRPRPALSPGLALAALLVGGSAAGSDTPIEGVRIAVARGAGADACPSSRELTERVAAVLAEAASRPRAQRAIDVEIGQQGERLVARVRQSGASPGTRTVDDAGPGCEALADALSLVIAMLVEPSLTLPNSAPRTVDGAPAPSPPPAAAPREARVSAGLLAAVATGVLERPALLVEASAAVRVAGPFRLTAGLFLLPREEHDVDPGTVTVSLWGGHVGAGWAAQLGQSVTLMPSARLSVGRISADGSGYYRDLSPRDAWLGAELGALLGLDVGDGVMLHAAALGHATLVGRTFSVSRVQTHPVFDPPSLGVWAGGGLSVTIF